MNPEPETLFCGWDIGGTKSSAVIGNARGEVLARASWPSRVERGPAAMLDDFLSQLTPLRKEFGPIASAGVSVGGPLDSKRGIVLSPPHLPGWDSLPLRDLLAGKLQLPVIVEHDAAACLLAEYLWGHAAGTTHAAYITAGTGCGAGIMIDGRILRGPSGQSPEIGHIRLAEKGPLLFGKAGCVESFCSGTGVALLAHELFPGRFPQSTPVPELAALAANGDAPAREVLLAAARWMGRTCAMLTDLFSLEVVIIGSLARYLPVWWLDEVRAEFTRESLPQNGVHTKITATALGDRLQDLSAIAPCVRYAIEGGTGLPFVSP